EPANHKALVDAVLRAPLEQLVHVLTYAKKQKQKMASAHAALAAALGEPANIEQLARTACAGPVEKLVPALKCADLGPKLIAGIDQDEWTRSHLSPKLAVPQGVAALERELRRLGRPA